MCSHSWIKTCAESRRDSGYKKFAFLLCQWSFNDNQQNSIKLGYFCCLKYIVHDSESLKYLYSWDSIRGSVLNNPERKKYCQWKQVHKMQQQSVTDSSSQHTQTHIDTLGRRKKNNARKIPVNVTWSLSMLTFIDICIRLESDHHMTEAREQINSNSRAASSEISIKPQIVKTISSVSVSVPTWTNKTTNFECCWFTRCKWVNLVRVKLTICEM